MRICKPKSFERTVQEIQYIGEYWQPLKPSPKACRLVCINLMKKMGVIWKSQDLVRYETGKVASLFPVDSFVDTDNLVGTKGGIENEKR